MKRELLGKYDDFDDALEAMMRASGDMDIPEDGPTQEQEDKFIKAFLFVESGVDYATAMFDDHPYSVGGIIYPDGVASRVTYIDGRKLYFAPIEGQ
jgi:hypothetical protein